MMAEVKTRRKRAPASAKHKASLGSADKAAEQSYSEALRRICDVVSDALGGQDEDEAAREAVDSFVPEFKTKAEMEAWWDSLPTVEFEVDPRLLEKVKTSIRLSRKVIDGFNFLAEQKGIRSGQTLMKIVLENYLAKSLPPDF